MTCVVFDALWICCLAWFQCVFIVYLECCRLATCLENLEVSGNLTAATDSRSSMLCFSTALGYILLLFLSLLCYVLKAQWGCYIYKTFIVDQHAVSRNIEVFIVICGACCHTWCSFTAAITLSADRSSHCPSSCRCYQPAAACPSDDNVNDIPRVTYCDGLILSEVNYYFKILY